MEIERCKTGIPGLDDLLRGGFPRGSAIVITGTPGTAKTIFALQFVVNGALNPSFKDVLKTHILQGHGYSPQQNINPQDIDLSNLL
jgi:archaellum biogenesis ATPase FlaH